MVYGGNDLLSVPQSRLVRCLANLLDLLMNNRRLGLGLALAWTGAWKESNMTVINWGLQLSAELSELSLGRGELPMRLGLRQHVQALQGPGLLV